MGNDDLIEEFGKQGTNETSRVQWKKDLKGRSVQKRAKQLFGGRCSGVGGNRRGAEREAGERRETGKYCLIYQCKESLHAGRQTVVFCSSRATGLP
jgi:hypothetical protein